MKKVNSKEEFVAFDDVMSQTFGEVGSTERTEYQTSVEIWLVGQKIKEIRKAKHLTQEDLGRLIGVQKAQISRIENGRNLTIETIIKVFRALKVDAKLQIAGAEVELSLS